MLVIIVVLAAILLAIIVAVTVHCCTKNKGTRVHVLTEMKDGAATANNSSVPNVTEDGLTEKGHGKHSDRALNIASLETV